MKYEIGDFVSKSVTGVCKIEDIVSLDLTGKKENKLYYLMKSIEDEKGKLYVPVSNSDAILRLCLTKEEAWKLIERIRKFQQHGLIMKKCGNKNTKQQ